MKRTLNFVLKIGDLDVHPKAVVSYEMQRNFSDIASPFSITLIDHPSLWLTDLELSMAAGHRDIEFSYSDSGEPGSYQRFSGQIWDYSPVFVGDIKRLVIKGNASRYVSSSISGTVTYNIDWNNYYNVRVHENLPWGALTTTNFRMSKLIEWQKQRDVLEGSRDLFLNSVTLDKSFQYLVESNSKMVKVTGRVGSIKLPIPDSFTTMIPYTDDNKPVDMEDVDGRFWGKLRKEELDGIVLYRESTSDKIRGFSLRGGVSDNFIQLNPDKEYFGAGQLVYNSTGVDVSYIVKQLAKLEGWDYKDEDIVQTELVPCSDKFKMFNQTAEQFIQDVLIPSAITPVGSYATTDNGKVILDRGVSGFVFYFDKNNSVHFKPLSTLVDASSREGLRNIKFGYNIKNSNVLSFQMNTKGTAFYTGKATKASAMEVSTGKKIETLDVTDQSAVLNYVKTRGHNEFIDNFFGYTYDHIKDNYDDHEAVHGWMGLKDARLEQTVRQSHHEKINGRNVDRSYQVFSSDIVNKGLVNLYPMSAVDSKLSQVATLQEVNTRIKNATVLASMSLWGIADLSPNLVIEITNMVKSTDSFLPTVHPTSGKYLIQSQEDVFSNNEYIQKLNLIRVEAVDLVQAQKINWSKRFEAAPDIISYSSSGGGSGSFGGSDGGGGFR